MAATVEQIAGFLKEDGLNFKVDGDRILTGFRTHHYKAHDGDAGISLVIRLEEDGEFLKIIAPRVYSYPDGPHKAVLFQLLLMISWDTKMIQYEYDMSDGEVRAIIEFPLEDATLTKNQLMRCLHGIAGLVDDNHENVVTAMTKGELPNPDEGEEMARLWQEFQAFVEQKRRAEGAGDHGLPT